MGHRKAKELILSGENFSETSVFHFVRRFSKDKTNFMSIISWFRLELRLCYRVLDEEQQCAGEHYGGWSK